MRDMFPHTVTLYNAGNEELPETGFEPMPSANATWGAYLRRHGFQRELAPEDTTVAEFADAHPNGTYILALSGHVVCIQDNTLYDSWDSSREIVLYFWRKE